VTELNQSESRATWSNANAKMLGPEAEKDSSRFILECVQVMDSNTPPENNGVYKEVAKPVV